MKVQLIVGASAIQRAINGVIKSATNAQARIHEVACSALAHAAQHGDVTLAAKLVYGLPKGVRANLVRKWFGTFGPIKFSDREMNATKDNGKDAKPFDLDVGMATPFWELAGNKPKVAEITLEAIVEYLRKKAKAQDSDSEETEAERKKIAQVATYAAALASPIGSLLVSPTQAAQAPAPETVQ